MLQKKQVYKFINLEANKELENHENQLYTIFKPNHMQLGKFQSQEITIERKFIQKRYSTNKIFYSLMYHNTQEPKASLIIVHGANEHQRRHFEVKLFNTNNKHYSLQLIW